MAKNNLELRCPKCGTAIFVHIFTPDDGPRKKQCRCGAVWVLGYDNTTSGYVLGAREEFQ